jgi:phage baseplate assembly protein W
MQVYDVDPNWAEVTGRLGLAQALARRLVTTHGSLIDDPDYGIDVREWINDDVSIADVQRLARTVEAEMLKDERVQRSQAVAVFVGDKLTLTIKIWDAAGPFKLVLQVSDVGIEKLQVTA